jgi:hypothetical protein
MKRALILAVCASCALPALASGTSSKVTIEYWNNVDIVGFVKSPAKSCVKNRSVTLYHKQGGPDEKLGTAKSTIGKGDQGYWHVDVDSPAGTYYAKMKAKDNCVADRSKDFDYPEDQP